MKEFTQPEGSPACGRSANEAGVSGFSTDWNDPANWAAPPGVLPPLPVGSGVVLVAGTDACGSTQG